MNNLDYENSSEAKKELGFFDRFFLSIERLAYTHSITVILISLSRFKCRYSETKYWTQLPRI